VNLHGELGIDHFLQDAAQGVYAAGGGGTDVEHSGLLESCAQSLLDDDSSAVSELFEVLSGGRERQGARGEREEGGSAQVLSGGRERQGARGELEEGGSAREEGGG
jgi:hypothetical protein